MEVVFEMVLRVQSAWSGLATSFMTVIRTGRPAGGQGLAEYALILALIAIVAIIALIFLGGQVSKILSTVGKSV
jgi:hypothetical protein